MNNNISLAPLLILCGVFGSYFVSDHYPPWTSFYNEFLMAISFLGLSVYCVYLFWKSEIYLSFASIFLLLICFIPLIQAANGVVVFWGDAWMASGYLLAVAITFSVGFNFAKLNVERTVEVIALLFLFVAIFSCGIVFYQWLEVDSLGIWVAEDNYGGRPTGNLGQPNNQATLLMLGVASCFYVRAKGSVGRALFLTVSLFLFAGIALTESRTAGVGVVFLLLWWGWKIKPLSPRISKLEPFILACLYVVFYFVNTPVSELLLLPGGSGISRLGNLPSDGRLAIWSQMIEAMKTSTPLGYGWNQVSSAQVKVVDGFPLSQEMTAYSHNIILDLLIWNGWIIGGVLVLIGGRWLIISILKSRKLEISVPLLWLGLLLVHSMLEFPFAYAYFLLPAAFLAGLVDLHISKLRYRVSKYSVLAVLVICVVFLSVVWRDYRMIEEDFRQMRFESAGLAMANQDGFGVDVLMLNQLQQYILLARTKVSPSMTDDKIFWIEKVCHRYPTTRSMYVYISALTLNGMSKQGGQELLKFRNLFGEKDYLRAFKKLQLLTDEYSMDFEYEMLPPL
ncbi:PglL family O-oligosaccharyltransferase [Zhongshania marina]